MEQKTKKRRGLNTPYDDAFKSIVKKCPKLAIPLINEMFYRTGLSDEEYTGQESVRLLDKELPSLDSPDREMDLRLEIFGKLAKIFHLECQSNSDGTILLRMVRYNMIGALEEAEYGKKIIHIQIDDSGVLYLRSTKNTPDVMTVELTVPQNQKISYQIPVLKIQDYSLDEMLERRLFILLPFLFFNFEKQLKQVRADKEVFDAMNRLFEDLIQRLEKLIEEKKITEYEASTLYDALKIVLEALGKKNKATKEVDEIMGGKVLEFSADKYFDAGVEEGMVKGEEKGLKEGEKKGVKKGEDKLSTLFIRLRELGRENDAFKAAEDPKYRKKLYKELKMA